MLIVSKILEQRRPIVRSASVRRRALGHLTTDCSDIEYTQGEVAIPRDKWPR